MMLAPVAARGVTRDYRVSGYAGSSGGGAFSDWRYLVKGLSRECVRGSVRYCKAKVCDNDPTD